MNEKYKVLLQDCFADLIVANASLEEAQKIYERNSNRGEQSGRLKQLESLITQAQELASELENECG